MNFSRSTRIARAARGISQRDLAQAAGCSPSTISLIEAGERKPSMDLAESIARALRIPFDLYLVLSASKREDCQMPARDAAYIGERLLAILCEQDVDAT